MEAERGWAALGVGAEGSVGSPSRLALPAAPSSPAGPQAWQEEVQGPAGLEQPLPFLV